MRKDLQPGDVIQIKPEKYVTDPTVSPEEICFQGCFAVVHFIRDNGVWAEVYDTQLDDRWDTPILPHSVLFKYGTFVYIGVCVYPMFGERLGEDAPLRKKA